MIFQNSKFEFQHLTRAEIQLLQNSFAINKTTGSSTYYVTADNFIRWKLRYWVFIKPVSLLTCTEISNLYSTIDWSENSVVNTFYILYYITIMLEWYTK